MMLFRTAFLHMERTEAVEEFANKKLGAKVERLAQGPVGGDLTFLVGKEEQVVKLNLKDKQGRIIAMRAAAKDMYGAVNKLANQLDKHLRRRKNKRIRHRTRPKLGEFLQGLEEEMA